MSANEILQTEPRLHRHDTVKEKMTVAHFSSGPFHTNTKWRARTHIKLVVLLSVSRTNTLWHPLKTHSLFIRACWAQLPDITEAGRESWMKNPLRAKRADLLHAVMRAALATKKQMSISAMLRGELLRSLKPISANVQMSSLPKFVRLTNGAEVRGKDKREEGRCCTLNLGLGSCGREAGSAEATAQMFSC